MQSSESKIWFQGPLKETQVVEISEALHYSVPHNFILVLARKTPAIFEVVCRVPLST